MTSHTSLSLSLTFLDILSGPFWAHLRIDGLAGQYAWTDERAQPTLRGVADTAANVDYIPLFTLHGAAERIGLDPDDVLDGIDVTGWVERCHVPQIGEPGIVVGYGLASLIDDGVPAEFVAACVRGGLRDAGMIRAMWTADIPAENATS